MKINLKKLLPEGYAWEREPGKPLPTLEDVMRKHNAGIQEIDTPAANVHPWVLRQMDEVRKNLEFYLKASTKNVDFKYLKQDLRELIKMIDKYHKGE